MELVTTQMTERQRKYHETSIYLHKFVNMISSSNETGRSGADQRGPRDTARVAGSWDE
jgi:hypothetical protein